MDEGEETMDGERLPRRFAPRNDGSWRMAGGWFFYEGFHFLSLGGDFDILLGW